MERKTLLRIVLLSTPLAAFLLYAALNWFRIEEEKVWVGASAEVRRDPFLAYARLLAKMGGTTESTDRPSRLDAMPERATLVLGARRLAYMTPTRLHTLEEWVDRGGSLIVEAEPWASTIRSSIASVSSASIDGRVAPETFAAAAGATREQRVSFEWPGEPPRLRVNFGNFVVTLRDSRARPARLSASYEGRHFAIEFPAGRGRVVAVEASPSSTTTRSAGSTTRNSGGGSRRGRQGWVPSSSSCARAARRSPNGS